MAAALSSAFTARRADSSNPRALARAATTLGSEVPAPLARPTAPAAVSRAFSTSSFEPFSSTHDSSARRVAYTDALTELRASELELDWDVPPAPPHPGGKSPAITANVIGNNDGR